MGARLPLTIGPHRGARALLVRSHRDRPILLDNLLSSGHTCWIRDGDHCRPADYDGDGLRSTSPAFGSGSGHQQRGVTRRRAAGDRSVRRLSRARLRLRRYTRGSTACRSRLGPESQIEEQLPKMAGAELEGGVVWIPSNATQVQTSNRRVLRRRAFGWLCFGSAILALAAAGFGAAIRDSGGAAKS